MKQYWEAKINAELAERKKQIEKDAKNRWTNFAGMKKALGAPPVSLKKNFTLSKGIAMNATKRYMADKVKKTETMPGDVSFKGGRLRHGRIKSKIASLQKSEEKLERTCSTPTSQCTSNPYRKKSSSTNLSQI